jgi:membrane dipeptidase
MIEVSEAARALHEDAFVLDLHVDTLLVSHWTGYRFDRRHYNMLPNSPYFWHADLPRMEEGSVNAVGLGVVVSPSRRRSAPAAALADLERMQLWVKRWPERLAFCGTGADLEAAHREGKVACFAGIEGAHALGGSLELLPRLRRTGARYLTLAHFSRNEACRPAMGFGQSRSHGLTDFGRALIDELNRLRITVDLAHVNRPGFLEAVRRSTAPVIVSHTGVSGVYRHWRNVDDEQIRAVADRGGAIGVIFSPRFLGRGPQSRQATAIVRHVQHLVKVGGEDCPAVGSDMDGCITLPRDLPDIAAMPRLTHLLLRAGLPEGTVRKVLGLNALRVLGESWGG